MQTIFSLHPINRTRELIGHGLLGAIFVSQTLLSYILAFSLEFFSEELTALLLQASGLFSMLIPQA